MAQYEALSGFEQFEFTFSDLSRPVYKLGDDSQPAVLIVLELPGMTEHTIAFAKRLNAQGYCVYLPLIFGSPNCHPASIGKNLFQVCIRKEFHVLATNKSSLITDWLRGLCREMRDTHGGQPVGAIGMCFTGGFVISLMIDDAVIAPVMTQPGHMGMITGDRWKSSLGIPREHLEQAKERSKRDNIKIMGSRFTKDVMCPKERFDAMERHFGDRFLRVDIDSSIHNEHDIKRSAHSVFTLDYNDTEGHPTRKAFDTLVGFLDERLKVKSEATV